MWSPYAARNAGRSTQGGEVMPNPFDAVMFVLLAAAAIHEMGWLW